MKLVFSETAWDDYLHWQTHDTKLLKRLNELIREMQPYAVYRYGQTGAAARPALRLVVAANQSRTPAGVPRERRQLADCSVPLPLLKF